MIEIPNKKRSLYKSCNKYFPFVMLIPALILFALFVFCPLISGVKISMTNWDGFSHDRKFIGFLNYINIFLDKNVVIASWNTIIYGIVSAILQNIAGLLFALLVDKQFKMRNAVKVAIYLPSIISGLVMGYIWYFMVQYDSGAINDLIKLMGFTPVDWMANGTRAVIIITLITSIQFVGVSMIIYLSGLQMIPTALMEAADLDGAGAWTKFIKIKIPLLMPSINTSFTLKLIGGLQLFDTIVALTRGGPGFSTHSISTYINYQYFENQNAGYATALGLLLFVFILFISIITNGYFSKKEVEY